MEIRPILSTLLRNRVGATLIALPIAFTMAVIINSVFIILDRAETMRKPIGIAPEHLVTVSVADVADDADLASVVSQDKLRLAELDGVIGATSQQYPLLMASLGIEAIAAFAADGTIPAPTEGKDFFDTGVALVTGAPAEGVPSISVQEGKDRCWG